MQTKQQDNQNKPQNYKEPNKSVYQYMEKDQNLPDENNHRNHISGKLLQNRSNYSRNQSPHIPYRGMSSDKKNHVIFHKIDIVDQLVEIISIEITIHDKTRTDQNILLIPVLIHTLGKNTILMIYQEIHRTKDIEIIPTILIEATQNFETKSSISK